MALRLNRMQAINGARKLLAIQRASCKPLVPGTGRPSRVRTAALPLDVLQTVPTETLVAGGAIAAGVVAFLSWSATALAQPGVVPAKQPKAAAEAAPAAPPPPPPPPREDAVLVLGATGRVGRRVVQRLLAQGRTVVAAVRSAGKARAVLCEQLGLLEGFQRPGERAGGILFIDEGVDVTRPETLDRPQLWAGVRQVVTLLGPVFGPQPGGGMGYLDGMSPERVEAEGAAHLAAAMAKHLPRARRTSSDVLAMRTAEDLQAWERLDDVIMGGQSSSGLEALPDGSGAVWRGDLIIEGGGFCGARTRGLGLDLSASDGIHLRVRGDGQTFKLNIKTEDQINSPESTYQATFDTVAGQWHDAYIPWHNFVPVKRAQSDPTGSPIDPSKIAKFGLVLSRFEFNKMPNPSYRPGKFELEIEGGLRAYRDVRPQVVMVSTASVERNAIIGDDAEARKREIPIVQLNPGGTLNHKYAGEIALRSTGYPYAVVRATGMIDSNEGGPFLVEADQGDTLSGSIGRDDVADVLCAALGRPEAAFKTFEIRRSEAVDGRGRAQGPMTGREYLRMFLKLSEDRHRWRVGLPPMPQYSPPPTAPVTEERRAEVLADVATVRAKLGITPDTPAPASSPAQAGAAPAPKELVTSGSARQ